MVKPVVRAGRHEILQLITHRQTRKFSSWQLYSAFSNRKVAPLQLTLNTISGTWGACWSLQFAFCNRLIVIWPLQLSHLAFFIVCLFDSLEISIFNPCCADISACHVVLWHSRLILRPATLFSGILSHFLFGWREIPLRPSSSLSS